MSGEHQGDMTSASLPAGGEPDALHLHTFSFLRDEEFEKDYQICTCGETQVWTDHDDGHAGGHPHWCSLER